MLRIRLALAGLLAATAAAQPAAAQQVLTLEQALEIAERNHPALLSARTQLGLAEAERNEARAPLWNNPQLSAEARRRRLADPAGGYTTRNDAGIGISQTFEIGGQPGARRAATQAALDATRQTIEQTRREIRGDVAKRFIEVLQLRRRVETEQVGADLLGQAAEAVAKRVKAGEDTRLDGNLAVVESERARAQLAQTRDELTQARAALATALQLAPAELPEVTGSLTTVQPAYRLDDLLSTAAAHPRLQAAAAHMRSAGGRLDLERAARYPDVTVGLSHSPEKGIDGTDRITTLSVSVPLPLFRNNDAAVARANAELEQRRIELQAARRDSEASVRVLWQRLEQLRERARRLETMALPALQENQRLSLAALRAGEINVTQFLLARRQTLDAQLELAAAQGQATLTRLELESAAGWDAAASALDPQAPTAAPAKETR
ncbi:MAG: TolC family protein [Burkholderiales bacterium]|nr:TolC family protein [Burkholderiales bacterium]